MQYRVEAVIINTLLSKFVIPAPRRISEFKLDYSYQNGQKSQHFSIEDNLCEWSNDFSSLQG